MRSWVLAAVLASASAPAPGAGQARESVLDREWQLVAVGERVEPRGAGGNPPTLQLDSKSRRAAGFAGCNRFSAEYRLAGDALAIGPILSTRMACERGMELEAAFLEALVAAQTFAVLDGELTLRGPVVLRFRAASP